MRITDFLQFGFAAVVAVYLLTVMRAAILELAQTQERTAKATAEAMKDLTATVREFRAEVRVFLRSELGPRSRSEGRDFRS